MDFNDSPEQAEFRRQVRAWLQAHARPRAPGQPSTGGHQEERLEEARAWYRKVYDAGYACLTWPKEYGGAGRTPIRPGIWRPARGALRAPQGPFGLGQGHCGAGRRRRAPAPTPRAPAPP